MQTKIARVVYLERFYLAISIHKAYCDTLKAFRIAQFSKNTKIQKITVKKFFFQNFDTGFLLIGVFRVYSRSFIAKLAETKISTSSEINPSNSIYLYYNRNQLEVSYYIELSKSTKYQTIYINISQSLFPFIIIFIFSHPF